MLTQQHPTVRVGAVSYLNSKPLIQDLDQLAPWIRLTLDYPSRLADALAAADLDVALIPSVEYLRNPAYVIVSDACVATRGPVFSVKLYSRVPMSRIRRLALDAGSRTSATLARVLLQERFGIQPELEPLPIGKEPQDTQADAIVLIGDRAMHDPQADFVDVWDLGEQWTAWTGLPFVFALWAARPHAASDALAEVLATARDRGIARLQEIAQRESAGLGIDVSRAVDYLRHNLHFQLGSAERSGLCLFAELSQKLGLVPEGHGLVFWNCTPAR